MNKFTETEFVFSESKDKAKAIIKELANVKGKNEAMKIIYKSLSYVITSRQILSGSINRKLFYTIIKFIIKII